MRFFLLGTLLVPFFSFLSILALRKQSEKTLSTLASLTKIANSACALAVLTSWALGGFASREFYLGELYRGKGYQFPLIFYFDTISAVFLLMTTFISAVIIRYCRYYLHRESGYCRFFATIMLFLFGMNLLVVAGNLDLLFASWEIIGISSFLLIAFYRERVPPVRNALRVYSVYRFCDPGLLLAIWAMHLIWSESQAFSHFSTLVDPTHGDSIGYLPVLGFSLLLLYAASGKSAQVPFCYWLPRAMEGPTPSSAIFYGALSVHAGVFLLLRTFPVWYSVVAARWAVGLVGGLSAGIATLCGRAQSNIKGHIAYSSVAQVGVMFVELALGWESLVLLHFVGNTCLRCYQLLISPSVVAHLLRIQGTSVTGFRIADWSIERALPVRWRSTLYAFAINEGYLELLIRRFFWAPLNRIGLRLQRIDQSGGRQAGIILGTLLICFRTAQTTFPSDWVLVVIALLILFFALTGLVERKSVLRSWNAAAFSGILVGVLVLLSDRDAYHDVWLYFVGTLPAWFLGVIILRKMLAEAPQSIDMRIFHGKAASNPLASFLLFACFLGLGAFPMTPSFLGEDVLLDYSKGNNLWMAVVIVPAYVLNGVTLIRLYARLCLGPDSREGEGLMKCTASQLCQEVK